MNIHSFVWKLLSAIYTFSFIHSIAGVCMNEPHVASIMCIHKHMRARTHTHTQHTHSIETRPIYCAHKFQVQFLFWDKTVCLLLFVNFISRHAHAAYCTTILCTVFSVEQTNTTQLTAVSRSQLSHNKPPHSCIMYTRGGQR